MMLSPNDVPNLFDKVKLQNEIDALNKKIDQLNEKDRINRAIDKIDGKLRRGVTRIRFWWWGDININDLIHIRYKYKDNGFNVDVEVKDFRSYLVFTP